MTSRYLRLIATAAVIICTLHLPPSARAALPPSASPASAADYVQFRKLAKPLRVLDLLKASQHDLARTAALMKEMPPKWHDTYDAVLARGIQANSEDVTDAIMHAAFISFTHDEVERLAVITQSPFLERFQTAKIKALYSYNADMQLIRQALLSDPDFIALAPADRNLMGRLIKATEGSDDLVEPMRPIIHAAVTEADATLDHP